MQGLQEFNRGVIEFNNSVARQGCNLLRAAVTSQGSCCGNLHIHPLDLGHNFELQLCQYVFLSNTAILLIYEDN